jgi:hypothetical protein
MGASRAIARLLAAGLLGGAIWQFLAGNIASGALAAVIALLIDRLGESGRNR